MERHSVRWLAQQLVWAAGLALVIGGVWWIRNALVYGWPDIFAQIAHNGVVLGQPRTADRIAEIGVGSYAKEYLTITYHSFWGQFGWMGVPMPARVYLAIGLFLLADVFGLMIAFGLFRRQLALEPWQTSAEWLLAAVILATIVNFIGYNLNLVQYQGRYLYTMLIPLGWLVALGLWGLSMWIGQLLLQNKAPRHEQRERLLAWLPLAALAWMPLLALWALFKYIVPNLG